MNEKVIIFIYIISLILSYVIGRFDVLYNRRRADDTGDDDRSAELGDREIKYGFNKSKEIITEVRNRKTNNEKDDVSTTDTNSDV